MKIRKEVHRGEMLPAWYGVAWIRWEADTAVCYPMPFNLVIAVCRALVVWIKYGHCSVYSNARDAYAQGILEGMLLEKSKGGK